MKPSATTSTRSLAPSPTADPAPAAPLSSGSGPACSACSTPSPGPPRSSATASSTSSPPTRSAKRCSPPVLDSPFGPANFARYIFLDPGSPDFYADWDRAANDGVALLRVAAGHDPYDRKISDLVGELSTRSDDFRVRWARHNVKVHTTGTKTVNHPLVGELHLDFESLDLPGDPGQIITTYTAHPGTPAQERLDLLGSWTAHHSVDARAPASEPQPEGLDS